MFKIPEVLSKLSFILPEFQSLSHIGFCFSGISMTLKKDLQDENEVERILLL